MNIAIIQCHGKTK